MYKGFEQFCCQQFLMVLFTFIFNGLPNGVFILRWLVFVTNNGYSTGSSSRAAVEKQYNTIYNNLFLPYNVYQQPSERFFFLQMYTFMSHRKSLLGISCAQNGDQSPV